ncbi:MAG: glycogen/starch/alpha-glucan phosphorylase [Desulfobulbaceae bacterium]|jgi:starch phosphorylase|nr:glycogen/starch/alpha-glucan phosphorylase [Desulfobulbaceae bacterium]
MAKKVNAAADKYYKSLLGKATISNIKKSIQYHLLTNQGRDPQRAGSDDVYRALAHTMRDLLVEKWISTQKAYYDKHQKRVYYLSLEFLVGRSLGNNAINLGLLDEVSAAVHELGYELEDVRENEEDAALGNGGLGRLASCFLDSIATLKIPAYGYGIRYEYGLFYQKIIDGKQVESPDNWMRGGCPWEFQRANYLFPVHYGGRVNSYLDGNGHSRCEWVETEDVMAMACDMMIPGFNNDHVVNMRLWTARSSREMDLNSFNQGNYLEAVHSKVTSETISKVLYPADNNPKGQELRLKQQYFFVAATFQDILRRFKKKHASFNFLPDKVAVQLNDTHPAIAIPEFMRLLMDKEGLSWEHAWYISVRTFAYTNHTLMPEALETWPVELLGRILPRHLEIIYEINHRFLEMIAEAYPGDQSKLQDLSIIDEGHGRRVRMAHLAIIGSHSVNGVAELHTHLLETRIFPAFYELYPWKFNNKTNGITQRRWLLKCNPGLSELISDSIGHDWVTDLDKLRGLEPFVNQPSFQQQWQQVKYDNKRELAELILKQCNVVVNPESMFDVQVKRIHEYKRQLLNCLHGISLYLRILEDPDSVAVARTKIFAGKAAPSYYQAKLIIELINGVADVVNNDPRIGDKLKIVFIPNYNVSRAEVIIPGADVSEQISTAGTEASGTGNMKFALNGALTVGTLDGANIEIREEVGAENIYIFGMTAEEIESEKIHLSRSPQQICDENPHVAAILETLTAGVFCHGNRDYFKDIVASLLDPQDPYLLLADLESYLDCQDKVDQDYRETEKWTQKAIYNVARMGKFSSDRTIKEYARDIWGLDV